MSLSHTEVASFSYTGTHFSHLYVHLLENHSDSTCCKKHRSGTGEKEADVTKAISNYRISKLAEKSFNNVYMHVCMHSMYVCVWVYIFACMYRKR